ncbi:hypothetical protein GCM10025868_04850 [Angustibacter aerolatus]|uniref:GGDEF domain-containing protein n=1 Tax=Angustibacter aerolatus TaxID=1162965 RepID=A0ABQ6JDE7_9ACTN|nr:hypothetical protein GCM10025868_04850 [Angustibacter aerolatus]
MLDGRAGTVLEANDTFTRWSGLSREAVVGSEFARLLPVGDRILWSTHCLPKLEAAGRVSEVSVQVVGADGGRRAAFLTASRAAGEDGRDGEVLVALFGAAERRRYEEDLLEATRLAEASDARRAAAEADLQHLAHHDPVTGLLNRRGLETALRSQAASSASSCTVVLFIDLDGFKQVNDSVGHTGGDEPAHDGRAATGRGCAARPPWRASPVTSSSSCCRSATPPPSTPSATACCARSPPPRWCAASRSSSPPASAWPAAATRRPPTWTPRSD